MKCQQNLKTYAVVNSPFRKDRSDLTESGLAKTDRNARPMKSKSIATSQSRAYQ